MNDKENILKLFKSGTTISGLVDMVFSQIKERERSKKPSERIKVYKHDIKNLVEKTIYEDYMKQAR